MRMRVCLAAIAVCAAMTVSAPPAAAADHRDSPLIQGMLGTTGNLDVNDLYLFRAPGNRANTVLIMTVAPGAGVVSPPVFAPNSLYEFRIDNTGDLNDDLIVQFTFSAPDNFLRQTFQAVGINAAGQRSLLARGVTNQNVSVRGGGMCRIGIFDDPFFFDALAFGNFVSRARAGQTLQSRVTPFVAPSIPNNFFGNFNTLAIIIEVPSIRLQSSRTNSRIGVWTRTVDSTGAVFDRTALPAVNTTIIPPANKNAFNLGIPSTDRANFRAPAIQEIMTLYGADATAAGTIADALLPDIMPFDTRSGAGFFNGRKLEDDVIDTELDILTGGALKTDRVINDSVFRANFPYMGPPLPPRFKAPR